MVDSELIKRIKDNLDRYVYLGNDYVMELTASELRELINYPRKDEAEIVEDDGFYGGVEEPWGM